MNKEYKGRVAFGFDPQEGIWTRDDLFEEFVIGLWDYQDEGYSEDRHEFYKGEGFDLAHNRDSAGAWDTAESVKEFFDIDLSDLPHTTLIDAYIDEEESQLVATFISEDSDMKTLENWELSPHEDLVLQNIEKVGSKYKVIYNINNLNITSI